MTQPFPIVFAADANFSVPLAIAVESLLVHARPETRYDVYVLDDGVLDLAKGHLETLRERYDFRISYLPVAEMVQGVAATCYFPRVSFARFLIPRLLPESVGERILYCDADVLICQDLSNLFQLGMESFPVGAITELGVKVIGGNSHTQRWKALLDNPEGAETGNYVNSGVLLFNRSLWMAGGYAERILHMARTERGRAAKYPDQDILNAVCRDNILSLPPCYNCVPYYGGCYVHGSEQFAAALANSPYTEAELASAAEKPCILHLAGPKPLVLEGARYPLEERFIQFWEQSAWRDYMPYAPRIGSMSPSRFLKQNVPISAQLGVLRKELLKYTLSSCLPLPKRGHYAKQRDAIRKVLRHARERCR